MWSALHLDDGTHTHAVGVPQMPGFGVGYVQNGRRARRDRVASTSTAEVADERADHERAAIAVGPDELDARRSSRSRSAPIRLEAPDGRVSPLPARDVPGRARPTAAPALGWIEWNRNQAARALRRCPR